MSHALRATSVALFVALVCALAVGSASATTMILEPAGEFTMTSNGAVTYSGEGIEFTCHLTISGEFERSIASIEREGGILGQIREEASSECTGGVATIMGLRLPWQIRIVRILGTLPFGVTGILFTIANSTVSFRLSGVLCLYVGAIGMLWRFGGGTSYLGMSYTRFSGRSPCPPTLIAVAAFTLSPAETASFE